MEDKLKAFAELLEQNQIRELVNMNLACEANIINCKVHIRPGKKYTKIDVGSSGKYMIDADGNIFGIKGYGQINKKKRFGTLDTIDQYFWGRYYGGKKGVK